MLSSRHLHFFLYIMLIMEFATSNPNQKMLAPLEYPTSINIRPFFNSRTGTYYFHYDTGNDGPVSFRGERRFEDGVVSGYYGYIDPNGVLRITHYTADNDGYRSKTALRYLEEGAARK